MATVATNQAAVFDGRKNVAEWIEQTGSLAAPAAHFSPQHCVSI